MSLNKIQRQMLDDNVVEELDGLNAQLAETVKKKMTIKDIVEPFVIAHRGGANVYPENTMDAYKGIVANGIRIIEQDVRLLSDGSLAVMHDSTVDRTTDGSGEVSDFYTSAWKGLNIDASSFLAPGYKNTTPPLMDEVFCEFGDSVIYMPETKNFTITEKLVDLTKKHKLEQNVIIQSFDLNSLQPAIDEGIVTLALGDNVDLNLAKDMGVLYISHSTNATDTYIQNIVNAGMKPIVYTINRRTDWDKFKAKGVVGCFSDDPLYISGLNTHIRQTDPFKYKTWYHGQIATMGTRGTFKGSNRWGYDSTDTGFCLQGWGSPIQLDTYKISFSLTYDSIPSNTGNWGSIAVCSPTDYFADYNQGSYGYHILLRANGLLQIYKVVNGGSTKLQEVQTDPLEQYVPASVEVSISDTSITATRTDGTTVSITANDATYRGKYFFLGHNTAVVSFSDVNIT